jgi:hypothetical protein
MGSRYERVPVPSVERICLRNMPASLQRVVRENILSYMMQLHGKRIHLWMSSGPLFPPTLSIPLKKKGDLVRYDFTGVPAELNRPAGSIL